MGYLHQVIDNSAVRDHGMVQGPPVYCGARTDLHPVTNAHASQLANFFPAVGTRSEAKAIGAEYRLGMYDTVFTDMYIVINRHMGVDTGSGAQLALLPNIDTRAQNHMGANNRPRFYDNVGADSGSGINLGIGGNNRRGMYTRNTHRDVGKQLGCPGIAEIGYFGNQAGRRALLDQIGRQYNYARPGVGQLCDILFIGDE